MYRNDTSYGGHQCSCRRKRLKDMHNDCTKQVPEKTRKSTYSECPTCTGKQSYSKPLIMDATFTKPTSSRPVRHCHTSCGCNRCENKRKKKRYICHCYETD